jgi:hypothetical protein
MGSDNSSVKVTTTPTERDETMHLYILVNTRVI